VTLVSWAAALLVGPRRIFLGWERAAFYGASALYGGPISDVAEFPFVLSILNRGIVAAAAILLLVPDRSLKDFQSSRSRLWASRSSFISL